jgi:hypothetical protein
MFTIYSVTPDSSLHPCLWSEVKIGESYHLCQSLKFILQTELNTQNLETKEAT